MLVSTPPANFQILTSCIGLGLSGSGKGIFPGRLQTYVIPNLL